eukprot:GHUV01006944.1.p1 GENE.GHUV01006944.1~~GHUV01006944.1.p1  ORF type:complete len:456 (+),score=159.52 GHUV01006944.1:2853-4220(+)
MITEWRWQLWSCHVSSHAIQVPALVLSCCTGCPAWLLLTVLAAEHLTNSGSLEPQSLLDLRRQLATHEIAAKQQLLGLPTAAGAPATRQGPAHHGTAAADPVDEQAIALPEQLMSDLAACGLTLSGQQGPNEKPEQAAGTAEGSDSLSATAAAILSAGDHRTSIGGSVHAPDLQQAASSQPLGGNMRSSGVNSQHSTGTGQGSGSSALPATSNNSAAMYSMFAAPAVDASVGQAAEASRSVSPRPAANNAASSASTPLRPPPPTPAAQQELGGTSGNLKAAALHCMEASTTSIGASSSSAGLEVPPTPGGATGRRTPDGRTTLLSSTLTRSLNSPRPANTSPRSARQRQYAEMYARPGSQRYRAASPAAAADAVEASTLEAASPKQQQLHVEEEGGPLSQPGAHHRAVLHTGGVTALDACNHTVVSVGWDGVLKVSRSSWALLDILFKMFAVTYG